MVKSLYWCCEQGILAVFLYLRGHDVVRTCFNFCRFLVCDFVLVRQCIDVCLYCAIEGKLESSLQGPI